MLFQAATPAPSPADGVRPAWPAELYQHDARDIPPCRELNREKFASKDEKHAWQRCYESYQKKYNDTTEFSLDKGEFPLILRWDFNAKTSYHYRQSCGEFTCVFTNNHSFVNTARLIMMTSWFYEKAGKLPPKKLGPDQRLVHFSLSEPPYVKGLHKMVTEGARFDIRSSFEIQQL